MKTSNELPPALADGSHLAGYAGGKEKGRVALQKGFKGDPQLHWRYFF